MEGEKGSEIEQAKALIEKDKNERMKLFQEELEALCKKYDCSLSQGQILIKAN